MSRLLWENLAQGRLSSTSLARRQRCRVSAFLSLGQRSAFYPLDFQCHETALRVCFFTILGNFLLLSLLGHLHPSSPPAFSFMSRSLYKPVSTRPELTTSSLKSLKFDLEVTLLLLCCVFIFVDQFPISTPSAL